MMPLNPKHILIPGESEQEFDALLKTLTDEFQPKSAFDELRVHSMAIAHWMEIRNRNLADIAGSDSAAEAKYNRYSQRFNREFHRIRAQMSRKK